MVCQPIRLALLIGALTAVAVSPVRAHHRASSCDCAAAAPAASSSSCCNSAPASNCGSTAPRTRTITVTECVPETYTVKRTAYKVECKTEEYDTCRTECVPEVRERTVCVTKRVPVMKTETRKVVENVTTYEDRCVTRNTYKNVTETVMQKKLVSRGHWEEQCVESHSLFGGLGGLFGGRGGHGHHKNACSDPCADPCANVCPEPKPMRTKKVWVHCPQYAECPVQVCKKVCVPETVTCKVAVCKQVCKEVQVQVCTYQCVTENRTEKYTVNVTRQVPCKATRVVRVCVPYEETVTCTKMVARQVTREVPDTSCDNACSTSCDPCASERVGSGLLSRFRGHHGGCCR